MRAGVADRRTRSNRRGGAHEEMLQGWGQALADDDDLAESKLFGAANLFAA